MRILVFILILIRYSAMVTAGESIPNSEDILATICNEKSQVSYKNSTKID